MELRSRKRLRPSAGDGGRDRLSEMPDEVLVHILSYLPILDAVRTVLLRPFGNLWTFVPTLKIDMLGFLGSFWVNHEWEEEDDERFSIFVRNALILHKSPSIYKFHLCVEFYDSTERANAADDIITWLRYALDRQANEIKFSGGSDFDYAVGSFMHNFTSQSLVTLELDRCRIGTELQVKLPSLKKLILDNCRMSNEELQSFISGCGLLQELVIKDPCYMNTLSFSEPNVDKLSLVLNYKYQRRNPFSLDCPKLKTLDLEVYYPPEIIDISSIRAIYVKKILSETYVEIPRELNLFYEKLDHAEVIHLSCAASRQFLDAMQHMCLSQKKWKRVVLELKEFCQVCLVGINNLMRQLERLEELTIYTTEDFKVSTDLPSSEVFSDVALQLKTIILYGYPKSWKSQLQLVEFLLKVASGLDEFFVIPVKDRLEAAEELKFVKRVSSFPRVSKSARVLFG